VLSLAGAGREVLGADLAPSTSARFESLRAAAGVDAARASLRGCDVLSYRSEEKFDLWWDYTFLCALHPADRGRWAECVDTLLAPRGELWVPVSPLRSIRDDAAGPPFRFRSSSFRSCSEAASGHSGHAQLAPTSGVVVHPSALSQASAVQASPSSQVMGVATHPSALSQASAVQACPSSQVIGARARGRHLAPR